MSAQPQILYAVADQLLFARGEFDPIAFLLDAGFVDEDAYRAWRAGAGVSLQSTLVCDSEEAVAALAHLQGYLLKQKLVVEQRAPMAWNSMSTRLAIGESSGFIKLCSAAWVRPTDRLQADLFQDTAHVVAYEGVRHMLADGKLAAASEALDPLESLETNSETVESFRVLIQAAKCSKGTPAEHLREIEERIAPLAQRMIGERARDYLALPWQALARRLSKTAYDVRAPKLHASYCYLQARRFKRVVEVIEAEPNWRQHAPLILRLAESSSRLGKKPRARLAWSQLCWDFPQEAQCAL